VAAGERAVLLGVTRQLVGSRWAGAGRFQYAGSLGPLSLRDPHIREFRRIGDCLARHFSLRGLFGVDTVVAGDAVWVIEVNPRYCASIEVFERATGMPCVSIHMDACRDGTLPETPEIAGGPCHGKAILFASEPAEVTPAFESLMRTLSQTAPWPALADLPPSNAVFRRGQPVLTVFADGATPREVLRNLRHRAEQLRSALSAPADVRRRRKR
jgi:predicted ATP-grasp superfamily ATP-dependent carboligase